MADNVLLSQYFTQPVVRQRNSVGLNGWAASMAAEAFPTFPDDPWVEQRIVAEQIPQALDNFVMRTLAYFQQDPATVANILLYLNSFNDQTTEETLSTEIDAVVAAFMPRFAKVAVSKDQIANWYTQNGITVKKGEPASAPPIPAAPPA
jgi:hypothetical protein